MNILLIHQAFTSLEEAGGTRHFELGQRLAAYGDHLKVVASQISYLTGAKVNPERGGLVYQEEIANIQVFRAYTFANLHRSFIWRVFTFIVFALTSVWAGLTAGSIDIVMGTTPPIFQAFSAWLVAALCRKPFLLEVRDLWPEFAIDMGILRNPMLIALAKAGERFLYARADHLLVNSPAYGDYLLEKGISPQKISFVANGVEVGMFDPASTGSIIRQKYNLQDKFLVVYAGAHGAANDLGTVLEAAQCLSHESDIHFLMVGDGKERHNLEQEAQRLKLTNMTFAGAVPKSQVPEILAASDACIAVLKNIKMFNTTYPNKVFDYMAAGRPTILAIDGVIRKVIENAQGGLFVPPGDVDALVSSIELLYHDQALCKRMGSFARKYVIEHFNREQQADEFRNVLCNMLSKPHQAQAPIASDSKR